MAKPTSPIWTPGAPGGDARHYWLFHETDGLVASDLAPAGRHAALSASGAARVAGPHGPALDLDGISGHADLPAGALVVPAGPFTLAARVRPEAFRPDEEPPHYGQRSIFHSGNPAASLHSISLVGSSGRAYFAVNWNTATPISQRAEIRGAPSALNQWTTVVGVYDGATLSLYQDGLQTGSTALWAAPIRAADRARIGRPSSTTPAHFDGQIDCVAVFDRALSGAEVAALHADWSSGAYSAASGSRRARSFAAGLCAPGTGPVAYVC